MIWPCARVPVVFFIFIREKIRTFFAITTFTRDGNSCTSTNCDDIKAVLSILYQSVVIFIYNLYIYIIDCSLTQVIAHWLPYQRKPGTTQSASLLQNSLGKLSSPQPRRNLATLKQEKGLTWLLNYNRECRIHDRISVLDILLLNQPACD